MRRRAVWWRGLAVLACALLIGGRAASAQQFDEPDDLRMVLNPPAAYPPLVAPGQMPQAGMTRIAARIVPRPPGGMERGIVLAQAKRPQQPAPGHPAPAHPGQKPVQAAAAPGAAGWTLQCPPAGQAGACQMVRQMIGADGRQIAAVVVAHDARQPAQIIATILLPLGIAVRESVPLLIDGRFIALMPIETCVPSGCVATVAMSPPMAQAWAAGKQVQFLTLSPQGPTVPIAVPLDGFGAAFARVAG